MSFGAPPPGGYGGPPPGGGYGGPPGGYGGPPGGPFGPPPGGPFGAPQGGPFAGPPMMPPQKSGGSSLPLILGLGCGGLVLLGLVGAGVAFFVVGRSVTPPPSYGSGPSPAVPAITTPPATGSRKAELRDLSPIKSKYGKSMRFVGEIVNTGESPIGYPSGKVTFYDAAGTALDSGNCSSLVRVLAAGDKVPCSFSLSKAQEWTNFKIEMTPLEPLFNGKIADIDISDIKFTAKRGYSPDTLEGKLSNKSAFKATSVWAIVSLYDSAKKIVGTTNALVAGNDLDGGQSGLFSAKVFEVSGTPESYRVIAVGYGE
jgi:hypothetical protein